MLSKATSTNVYFITIRQHFKPLYVSENYFFHQISMLSISRYLRLFDISKADTFSSILSGYLRISAIKPLEFVFCFHVLSSFCPPVLISFLYFYIYFYAVIISRSSVVIPPMCVLSVEMSQINTRPAAHLSCFSDHSPFPVRSLFFHNIAENVVFSRENVSKPASSAFLVRRHL